jgi:RNA polymerase sigma-70 factor, ECF subfamily
VAASPAGPVVGGPARPRASRDQPGPLIDTSVDAVLGLGQSRTMAPNSATTAGDPALVRSAQGGNRDAFGELYERYGSMVHGLLVARVPYDAVDDLVQDVFLVALQRLDSLRNPSAFGAWLAAIARNRAVDYHRRTPISLEPDGLAAPDEAQRAEALAVLGVIRTLPEAYRETLTLRLVEGMTGPEIAERTGLTPASVRVNLHRGMKKLREQLERKQGGS